MSQKSISSATSLRLRGTKQEAIQVIPLMSWIASGKPSQPTVDEVNDVL